MKTKPTIAKTISRAAELTRGGLTAALVPAFFIYVLIDKPDYKIMNAASGIVVPAARAVGDAVTWPVRAIGNLADNVREHNRAISENRELRAKLSDALRNQNECSYLLAENQKLEQQLDLKRALPQRSILAGVVAANSALQSDTFTIDKGAADGVRDGNVVVSQDGFLVGLVINTADGSAKVRALSDAKSSIPVRVAGSTVYGFLTGSGSSAPRFEFYSDQAFVPTPGIRLLTSKIKGTLPNNIPVGVISDVPDKKYSTAKLGARADKLTEVMVLEFDNAAGYTKNFDEK